MLLKCVSLSLDTGTGKSICDVHFVAYFIVLSYGSFQYIGLVNYMYHDHVTHVKLISMANDAMLRQHLTVRKPSIYS